LKKNVNAAYGLWRVTPTGTPMTKGDSMKGTRHGMSGTREYAVWRHIKDRCLHSNGLDYKNYGGRGITICDRWRYSFMNFFADMGLRPSNKHTIDRIDNDGNYEPLTCQWATRQQQARNTRIQHNNKTGLSGVCRTKNGTYRAYITVEGKRIYLDTYKTLFDAACARKSAEALKEQT
jgi:hypothetical protein